MELEKVSCCECASKTDTFKKKIKFMKETLTRFLDDLENDIEVEIDIENYINKWVEKNIED